MPKIEAFLNSLAMNLRIGSWFRYTDPVSIAGMLTMVVGKAPMWLAKNVKPANCRFISGGSARRMSPQCVGLKAVEHEMEDVLLR